MRSVWQEHATQFIAHNCGDGALHKALIGVLLAVQTRSGDTIRFTWLLKKPNKNFINSADICLFKIKKKH